MKLWLVVKSISVVLSAAGSRAEESCAEEDGGLLQVMNVNRGRVPQNCTDFGAKCNAPDGFFEHLYKMPDAWEQAQGAFELCCIAAGHSNTTCHGVGDETFSKHQVKDFILSEALCMEMTALGVAHDFFEVDHEALLLSMDDRESTMLQRVSELHAVVPQLFELGLQGLIQAGVQAAGGVAALALASTSTKHMSLVALALVTRLEGCNRPFPAVLDWAEYCCGVCDRTIIDPGWRSPYFDRHRPKEVINFRDRTSKKMVGAPTRDKCCRDVMDALNPHSGGLWKMGSGEETFTWYDFRNPNPDRSNWTEHIQTEPFLLADNTMAEAFLPNKLGEDSAPAVCQKTNLSSGQVCNRHVTGDTVTRDCPDGREHCAGVGIRGMTLGCCTKAYDKNATVRHTCATQFYDKTIDCAVGSPTSKYDKWSWYTKDWCCEDAGCPSGCAGARNCGACKGRDCTGNRGKYCGSHSQPLGRPVCP